ncbi:di-trans,poly-cis-decaprenylcistransferase [Streptomyces verrucosisporus]|uniref:polyprenyl diphosphate synthase n=1 Tax=Streptomyces verrucosisporus TaxID=1695161 RepID=UPI0019CF921F|nr:polyprenyl diphosphate synthase [Streptomyces verrucosisporus]MBN3932917.1 di-trans,poly-cis-decaprenylcistransferase [Streptomyces verrucosisporus]
MSAYQEAGITTPELCESYARCEEVAQRLSGLLWTATESLPADVRPHVRALVAYWHTTDDIADEGRLAGREARLSQWCADSLAEVRAGHSEHPLRRALVHTVRSRELDIALLEEFLDTTRKDSAAPPAFDTAADLRRYLRGVTGAPSGLLAPLLAPRPREAVDLLRVVGEACQMADIFQDFPTDLGRGRCYLPEEDLGGLGLRRGDLLAATRRDALDELVGVQVARTRDLLARAAPVTGKLHASCRPFVHGLLLGVEHVLDQADHLGARVLAEGVDRNALLSHQASGSPAFPVPDRMPGHVAVIMDGNRRWAAAHGLPASDGHVAGARAALRLVHSALRLGVPQLSVFAFSTENWVRSTEEVTELFATMAEGFTLFARWMRERGVRVRWCGRRDRLDPSLASTLAIVENMTSRNTTLTLNVFADYGGREEIASAARALAAEAVAGGIQPRRIGPEDVARSLYTPDLPDVDLLIRTSGEQRLSNFLPWHLAYAEFVFEPVHWPDFGHRHLRGAIDTYAGRLRRFGGDATEAAQPAGTEGIPRQQAAETTGTP